MWLWLKLTTKSRLLTAAVAFAFGAAFAFGRGFFPVFLLVLPYLSFV
jgi:hypothetical protein